MSHTRNKHGKPISMYDGARVRLLAKQDGLLRTVSGRVRRKVGRGWAGAALVNTQRGSRFTSDCMDGILRKKLH